MEPDKVGARLAELRGDRKQRTIATLVGVTPQAISQWEKTGRVARQYVEAYDDALGADGEVLDLLGFTRSTGPSLTDVMERLDDLLALVRGMDAAQLRTARLVERLVGQEVDEPSPEPPTSLPGRRAPRPSSDPTGPLPRP